MDFKTPAQQDHYNTILAAAEKMGYTITPDETDARIILRANKTNSEGQVGIVLTVHAKHTKGPTVIKGHGVTAAGRTVHIKNPAAAITFLKSHWA